MITVKNAMKYTYVFLLSTIFSAMHCMNKSVYVSHKTWVQSPLLWSDASIQKRNKKRDCGKPKIKTREQFFVSKNS